MRAWYRPCPGNGRWGSGTDNPSGGIMRHAMPVGNRHGVAGMAGGRSQVSIITGYAGAGRGAAMVAPASNRSPHENPGPRVRRPRPAVRRRGPGCAGPTPLPAPGPDGSAPGTAPRAGRRLRASSRSPAGRHGAVGRPSPRTAPGDVGRRRPARTAPGRASLRPPAERAGFLRRDVDGGRRFTDR